MDENPLGRKLDNPTGYDPSLLYAIPRQEARSQLGIEGATMHGFDVWRAWELSWLDSSGRPRVAMGRLVFDCHAPKLIESKSLKLYLNSFNQEHLANEDTLLDRLVRDLSAASGSRVGVSLIPAEGDATTAIGRPAGRCLDGNPAVITDYTPRASLLATLPDSQIEETLYSDLFRSTCPVTGQPDWATVTIGYRGAKIEDRALLAYLCSFRNHQGFHEVCAETIYRDLLLHCRPDALLVGMHFTRRGGLDINPYRGTEPLDPDSLSLRTARQ